LHQRCKRISEQSWRRSPCPCALLTSVCPSQTPASALVRSTDASELPSSIAPRPRAILLLTPTPLSRALCSRIRLAVLACHEITKAAPLPAGSMLVQARRWDWSRSRRLTWLWTIQVTRGSSFGGCTQRLSLGIRHWTARIYAVVIVHLHVYVM
jgi:hypothetical protein